MHNKMFQIQFAKFKSNNNIFIDVSYERNIWNKFLFKKLINQSKIFLNCKYESVSVTENNSILNPNMTRCSSNKCRKKRYLRHNTFLGISLIYHVV